ncbi:thioredoxin family protein [candidate division KSB1 bacterium]|nr:thioredoxin family protein [candidate division KSB1 bacterium]
MKRIFSFCLISILAFSGGLARAEDAAPALPVRAVLNLTAIAAGGSAELGVLFDVPKGHHITDVEYGLFFVETPDTFGLDFGTAAFPAGIKFHDERAYRGKNLVRIPVQAAADVPAAMYSVPIKIGYQICQEFGQEICFLPEERELTLNVNVVAAGTKVDEANADVFKSAATASEPERKLKRSLEDRLMAALEQGSWMAFLIAFIGGVLASFTPCVYPVIPITIGYIGGSSGGKPLRGLGLSAIFALGIAVVYSSLGLFAAATGSIFGSISGSPLVNVVIALVFGLMGVSMLGVFDIALPSALQTALSGGSSRRGLFGPLLLGMASGLVMAPCVGPIIVALLAWVAKTGNLFYGWALLFVFSFGLGLLFLVIGTFSGAIQALPRAGAWMEAVKKGFGWILLAGALYMLRFVVPEPYYTLAWAVLLVIASVFLGAFDSLTTDSTSGRRLGKAVALLIFLVGAISMFKALGPRSGVVETGGTEVTWLVNEEEQALAQAQTESKPLLIDVYADWCAACVELDERTYIVPDVVARVDGFVRLKLDFTKETEWVKEMKAKYKITGMPTVILYDATGDEVTRFTGFKPARDFLSLLDEHNL